jgi:hypothetical protein
MELVSQARVAVAAARRGRNRDSEATGHSAVRDAEM